MMVRTDTYNQCLDTAERLFAQGGFDGVSLAAVAGELGLTKQALLHHFSNKAGLYGAVLQRLSEEIGDLTAGAPAGAAACAALEATVLTMFQWSQSNPSRSRLLMRELLDNNRRSSSANTWYLKDVLRALTTQVKAARAPGQTGDGAALACAYQLLGAISYFAISKPTLTGILGRRAYRDMQSAFEDELRQRVRAAATG